MFKVGMKVRALIGACDITKGKIYIINEDNENAMFLDDAGESRTRLPQEYQLVSNLMIEKLLTLTKVTNICLK